MKYLIIFEELENNYFAYIPDFPDCIATGKTKEETEKNICCAIEFYI